MPVAASHVRRQSVPKSLRPPRPTWYWCARRPKHKKQREEIWEALKWVAFTLLGIGVFVLLLVMGLKAFADGKMYNAPKDYTYQQKVWQGKIEPKKYTTCRLKKRLTSKYTNKKACIYEGNNKTYTMMIEVFCPRQFKCEYKTLNSKMPDIDKVMDSLRSIKD